MSTFIVMIIISPVLFLLPIGEFTATFTHDIFYETTYTTGHWKFKKETKCLLPEIDWRKKV